jgi:hypothetical protein
MALVVAQCRLDGKVECGVRCQLICVMVAAAVTVKAQR